MSRPPSGRPCPYEAEDTTRRPTGESSGPQVVTHDPWPCFPPPGPRGVATYERPWTWSRPLAAAQDAED
jgi:hypothetical protein